MPDALKFIYWDSDVFLSYINGIEERLKHLDVFLEESGNGFQLVTSTVSIVEVAFAKAEQDGKALDTVAEVKINKLWIAGSPNLTAAEFHTYDQALQKFSQICGFKICEPISDRPKLI